MIFFKRFFSVLGLLAAWSQVNAVISLNGPFSEESQKLIERTQTTEKNPTLDALRYFKGLDLFHADFRELSQTKARALLKPDTPEPILEAIIQIIKKNKPSIAIAHFNPYSDQANEKLLLAKIALMMHHKNLFESLIGSNHDGYNDFAKDALFMILYEAQPQDLDTAKSFIDILISFQKPLINTLNQLGLTPLAVAAVTQRSVELTRHLLTFKPNVNFVMQSLFLGRSYSDSEPGYTQTTQFMTVLDLVDNALDHETNARNKQHLETIKTMVVSAGGKPTTIWKIDLD